MTTKLRLPKYDAQKFTGMDYDEIKIAYRLLNEGAVVTSNSPFRTNDRVLSILIEGDAFTMRLAKVLPDSPIESLHYGENTWSLGVTNTNGKRVMYSSAISPTVAQAIGKLLDDMKEVEDKEDTAKDWEELEAYVDFEDTHLQG